MWKRLPKRSMLGNRVPRRELRARVELLPRCRVGVEQQRRAAEAVAQHIARQVDEQQCRQHLGHAAAEAQRRRDARPQRAAHHRHHEREQKHARAAVAGMRAEIRGEDRAEDQLAFLADVDEPGAVGDDRTGGDEQQRREHVEGGAPRAVVAQAAVDERREDLSGRTARARHHDGRHDERAGNAREVDDAFVQSLACAATRATSVVVMPRRHPSAGPGVRRRSRGAPSRRRCVRARSPRCDRTSGVSPRVRPR